MHTFSRLIAGVLFAAFGSIRAADPPKPLPVPSVVPAPVPATLAVPADATATAAKAVPAGERFAYVQVAFVQVPHDVAEAACLVSERLLHATPFPLSKREAKLLTALMAADSRCTILSHPQLTLTDGTTGYFQVDQTTDVVGPLTVKEEKGEKVVTGKVTTSPECLSLRLTPTIAAGAGGMTAKAEVQHVCVSSRRVSVPLKKADGSHAEGTLTVANPVYLNNGSSMTTAIDTQTLQADLKLAAGETVVLCGIQRPGKTADGKPDEVLVIVQGAVGVGTKK